MSALKSKRAREAISPLLPDRAQLDGMLSTFNYQCLCQTFNYQLALILSSYVGAVLTKLCVSGAVIMTEIAAIRDKACKVDSVFAREGAPF